MLLGLDVGGTHTDAVIIDGSRVIAAAKTPTNHNDLLQSVHGAMQMVLHEVSPRKIKQVNLSTTLSTNAIIEGKTEDVGVIVASGPGMDPENHRIGRIFHLVGGAMDHRGEETQPIDPEKLSGIVEDCKASGSKVFAAVGKFSTRNPVHEDMIREAVGDAADFMTVGHSLSGVLNFPRRIATAYFNSAVWRIYRRFVEAVEDSFRELGLNATVNVLKADGGTMPLQRSKELPVESILSGPAASVMGIIALCDIREDSVILDIGGTTTDIIVFAGGAPLVEPEGMTVGSYATLVRSLKIRSLGIGGDSTLHFRNNQVIVGPDRQGPSLAAGSENGSEYPPTLTDAMNFLGLAEYGDRTASENGIRKLAGKWGLEPGDLAQQALDNALKRIREATNDFLDEINERPVYTIHELLHGKRVRPQKVYLMGGPARVTADPLGRIMGLEVVVPKHYAYANAVGAALTRVTLTAELFADTRTGILLMPSLNIRRAIPSGYTLKQAEKDALKAMSAYLDKLGNRGIKPELVESASFSMVEGLIATGKNIRVKCQIKPAVIRAVH